MILLQLCKYSIILRIPANFGIEAHHSGVGALFSILSVEVLTLPRPCHICHGLRCCVGVLQLGEILPLRDVFAEGWRILAWQI
jgi:hypothetical protein